MAGWFRKLASEAAASGEPNAGFKRNAFVKAAAALEGHQEAIKSGKQASKLAGIGKGSVSLIDEYLETGVMGEKSKAEAATKAAAEAPAEGCLLYTSPSPRD